MNAFASTHEAFQTDLDDLLDPCGNFYQERCGSEGAAMPSANDVSVFSSTSFG
jgi:hypothetical protein